MFESGYQFSALKKEKNMLKKVVIPAEAGIQIPLSWSWIPVFTLARRSATARRHGNDRENGPLKSFVSKG
jgi:hypothetical protein